MIIFTCFMAGDDIYLNNDTMPKALINNLPVNRQADIRTISTRREINEDLINWFNEYWLIISEIGQKIYILQRDNPKMQL